MAWVDWAIVIVLLLSVVGGLTQGFFRSVCALGGLVLGLALAAWNYDRLAACIMPIVHLEAVANTIAFLLIALLVMALTGLIGKVLSKTLHQMGLGCLDRLAGGVFGFFQGALLITLCILVTEPLLTFGLGQGFGGCQPLDLRTRPFVNQDNGQPVVRPEVGQEITAHIISFHTHLGARWLQRRRAQNPSA